MDYETHRRAAISAQDKLVECPYNPSHLIGKSKMQYHLVKCAKQHGVKALETCPFNATHRIPKPELAYHVSECPDRRILENQKFQTDDDKTGRGSTLSDFVVPKLPPSDENWDDEDVKTSYNPEQHISDKLIFRNLQGATKSERKQFRMQERRRVNQLVLEGVKEPAADDCVESNVTLRLPKRMPSGAKLDPRLGMGRGSCSFSSDKAPGSHEPKPKGAGRGVVPRY